MATFDGLLNGAEEYGIKHRPNREGPPLHDMHEGGLAPNDIYDAPVSWYTGYAELASDTQHQMRASKGKPDRLVFIYRAGPTEVLNSGDWVSLSRPYTDQHRDAMSPETYKTCVFKVPAKTVRWAGDDLMEWGYYGPAVRRAMNCYKSREYVGTKKK